MIDKVKAVVISQYGGSDVLRIADVALPALGPRQVLLRHTAIGLNYSDIHNRSGRYPLPHLPHVLGVEGVGVIEAVGSEVTDFSCGDRVGYGAGGPAIAPGSYSEARVMDTQYLILLPDEINDITAAGMLVKGLTVQYLIKSVYPVTPADTIVLHAAAGGIGQILAQWANFLGARVIGVVGSQAKRQVALDNGCHHVLVRAQDNVVQRVKQITAGEGASVVFDSVGKDTYMESLACLRARGTLVSFGTASGKIPPFDLFLLNKMGSLSITSAAFASFFRNHEEVVARGKDLLDVVLRQKVKINVNNTFDLGDVVRAHDLMEARQTQGSSVLLP